MDYCRSEPQATPAGPPGRRAAEGTELSEGWPLATFALQLGRLRNATSRVAHGPARGPSRRFTWRQVGRVTEPGRYMFRFGWLTIAAEDLAVWEQLPNAGLPLVRTAAEIEEYRLGAFNCGKISRFVRSEALFSKYWLGVPSVLTPARRLPTAAHPGISRERWLGGRVANR